MIVDSRIKERNSEENHFWKVKQSVEVMLKDVDLRIKEEIQMSGDFHCDEWGRG